MPVPIIPPLFLWKSSPQMNLILDDEERKFLSKTGTVASPAITPRCTEAS